MADEREDFKSDGADASAGATDTRARLPGKKNPEPPHGDEVENRIHAIMDLMRALQWRRGTTGQQLAAQWGLHEQRVKELSAEASKRLRAEYEDPDRAVVSVYTTLETVMQDGATSGIPGEKAAAVAAARLMAELSGMGKQNEPKEPAGPMRLIVETVSAERPKVEEPPSE